MKKMTMVYLASPYSPVNADEKADKAHYEKRYNKVTEVVTKLQAKYWGEYVFFAPITHSHPMTPHLDPKLQTSEKFWLDGIDLPIIKQCMDEIWVVTMKGWNNSSGISRELYLANELNMPVRYVCPTSLIVTMETEVD